MRTPVKLRTLTAVEVTEIKRFSSSRKEAIRLVQHTRIIVYLLEDSNLYASEAGRKAGYAGVVTGPVWIHRFNEKGLAWKISRVRDANLHMTRKFTANWSARLRRNPAP